MTLNWPEPTYSDEKLRELWGEATSSLVRCNAVLAAISDQQRRFEAERDETKRIIESLTREFGERGMSVAP